MKQYFLIHYGEIGLKGKNRPQFENQLVVNIRLMAEREKIKTSIKRLWGKILLESNQTSQEKVIALLQRTFGIVWFASGKKISFSWENLKKVCGKIAQEKTFTSFAIRARTGGEKIPRQEIEVKIGDYIRKRFQKKVNLENPDLTFYIEAIGPKTVFIFTQKYPGPGGLPVGSSGKALCLISGGIDSPVAAYLMMKRGLKVDFVHFHSYPQTSRNSINKVKDIVKTLTCFQPKSKLFLVPLLPLQKKLYLSCNRRYLVLLYRRAMLRIAEAIAKETKAAALITGDSLGQVASQTVQNLSLQNEAVSLPILRPLVSFDKEEIIKKARKIGTFEISILPHQDCCSLFVPKHPATQGKLSVVKNEEKKIPLEKLIHACLKEKEVIDLSHS